VELGEINVIRSGGSRTRTATRSTLSRACTLGTSVGSRRWLKVAIVSFAAIAFFLYSIFRFASTIFVVVVVIIIATIL